MSEALSTTGVVIHRVGHTGKQSQPGDLGAVYDLDHSGRVDPDEAEALVTPEYIGVSCGVIGRRGHKPLIWARGDYSEDWARAAALAKANPKTRFLYVACHLNVGAQYGLVGYDARSLQGQLAAQRVGARLDVALPALDGVRVTACDASGPWANMYHCIRGIFEGPANLTAICFEPVSLNIHLNTGVDNTLSQIGFALGSGACDWLEQRELP